MKGPAIISLLALASFSGSAIADRVQTAAQIRQHHLTSGIGQIRWKKGDYFVCATKMQKNGKLVETQQCLVNTIQLDEAEEANEKAQLTGRTIKDFGFHGRRDYLSYCKASNKNEMKVCPFKGEVNKRLSYMTGKIRIPFACFSQTYKKYYGKFGMLKAALRWDSCEGHRSGASVTSQWQEAEVAPENSDVKAPDKDDPEEVEVFLDAEDQGDFLAASGEEVFLDAEDQGDLFAASGEPT